MVDRGVDYRSNNARDDDADNADYDGGDADVDNSHRDGDAGDEQSLSSLQVPPHGASLEKFLTHF